MSMASVVTPAAQLEAAVALALVRVRNGIERFTSASHSLPLSS